MTMGEKAEMLLTKLMIIIILLDVQVRKHVDMFLHSVDDIQAVGIIN